MEILEQKHGFDYIEGHLGGCSSGGDNGTYYPIMWNYLVDYYNIKSILDVGCGRGFSTKFFNSLNCNVLGIEGCIQAIDNSLIPQYVRFNDYEKSSSLNKEERFDLCWCCEFVEHVWEKYAQNFINDFKHCKYLAMTFAAVGQGGHHHVNENTQEYWINLLEKNRFKFLMNDTQILRDYSMLDKEKKDQQNAQFFISHFTERGLFFVNLDYDIS